MAENYLDEIVIGLGAANGYSGDDLTNARDAAIAGEVPYLASGTAPVTPLELRIHGVGGAPPQDNLETPSTVQVSGDATAGFFRAWYPGGSASGKRHREAYCWGGLNTRSRWRALWLILLAFMFVNVSYWALPGRNGFLNVLSKAILRLLGLALTVAFVGTAVTLLGDIVATQAPRADRVPHWMGAYGNLGNGPRLAIALLAILAMVGVLGLVSVQTTRAYEKWSGGKFATTDDNWELTKPNFWRGERTVSRQRYCHVAVASAEVMMFAAMASSTGLARSTILWAAGLIGAVAVILIASEWCERSSNVQLADGAAADSPEVAKRAHRAALDDEASRIFGYGAAALAACVCISRFWWAPDDNLVILPGDQALQTTIVLTEFCLVFVLLIAVLGQLPGRVNTDAMAFGLLAPLLAGLACCVATIFGASLTLAVTNSLGSPAAGAPDATMSSTRLFLPNTTYAGGLGMLVAVICAVGFAVIAGIVSVVRKRSWSRPVTSEQERREHPERVAASYPKPGGEGSLGDVAGVWSIASLTDLAPLALAILVLPTAVLVLADLAYLEATSPLDISSFVEHAALYGGTVGVLAIGAFLVQMRSALLHATARKRFGTLWDVGTFWPRACHPFAPPCYAERSIPELVTRVRRIVGDAERCDDQARDPAVAQQGAEAGGSPQEAHRPVLITGYSQGTPIAVALVAQLPKEVQARVALLTLAAPVRRLYGRAFPAYFGAPQLDILQQQLTHDGDVWWRNTVRRSDYIGGWVMRPIPPPVTGAAKPDLARQIDHEINDPPVLWADDDPTPPPAHRHSDMFPDPQAHPYADELIRYLSAPVAPTDAETAA